MPLTSDFWVFVWKTIHTLSITETQIPLDMSSSVSSHDSSMIVLLVKKYHQHFFSGTDMIYSPFSKKWNIDDLLENKPLGTVDSHLLRFPSCRLRRRVLVSSCCVGFFCHTVEWVLKKEPKEKSRQQKTLTKMCVHWSFESSVALFLLINAKTG